MTTCCAKSTLSRTEMAFQARYGITYEQFDDYLRRAGILSKKPNPALNQAMMIEEDDALIGRSRATWYKVGWACSARCRGEHFSGAAEPGSDRVAGIWLLRRRARPGNSPILWAPVCVKVRAELITGDALQIRIYCNGDHVDYSYQLLNGGLPVQRWDNKEHFPEIASHPHHFHSSTGEVEISPLTGDPEYDLSLVMSLLFPPS